MSILTDTQAADIRRKATRVRGRAKRRRRPTDAQLERRESARPRILSGPRLLVIDGQPTQTPTAAVIPPSPVEEPQHSTAPEPPPAPAAVPVLDLADAPHDPIDLRHSGKNPAAVALGKLGGCKGGPARARSMSPEMRSKIARIGAAARWVHGVACPHCGAPPGRPCTTSKNRFPIKGTHPERWAARSTS